jgi:tetratricopeptide (TPR) repeat protein
MLAAAAANYRRALRLKPDLAEVHNDLGRALQGLGELERAVACYRQALRLKPDYAEAHMLVSKIRGLSRIDDDARFSTRTHGEIPGNRRSSGLLEGPDHRE